MSHSSHTIITMNWKITCADCSDHRTGTGTDAAPARSCRCRVLGWRWPCWCWAYGSSLTTSWGCACCAGCRNPICASATNRKTLARLHGFRPRPSAQAYTGDHAGAEKAHSLSGRHSGVAHWRRVAQRPGRMEWFNLIAAEHFGFSNPRTCNNTSFIVRDPQFVNYWLKPVANKASFTDATTPCTTR